MNAYIVEFFARCPTNDIRIAYCLRIETQEVIRVESIVDAVDQIRSGFHEAIADDLHAALGGTQTIIADHHGVTIETTRP